MTIRNCRNAAVVGLVLTGFAVLYLVVATVVVASAGSSALDTWEFSWGYLLQALIHLGGLAGVIALAWSGAVGAGLSGRVGLGAAMLGQTLLAIAELVYPSYPGIAEPIFTVAPPLSGAGMILAGITVLRAGVWRGWYRFIPLAVGLWVFVVFTPALVVGGPPPAPTVLSALAGWNLLWVLLAVAALAGATLDRTPAVAR